MRIKFLRDRRSQKAGRVYDWPDGAAEVLIKRGFAEEVKPESNKPKPQRRHK